MLPKLVPNDDPELVPVLLEELSLRLFEIKKVPAKLVASIILIYVWVKLNGKQSKLFYFVVRCKDLLSDVDLSAFKSELLSFSSFWLVFICSRLVKVLKSTHTCF